MAATKVNKVVGQADNPNSAKGSWLSLIGACALLFAVVAPAALITAVSLEKSLSTQALLNAALAGSVCYVAAALSLVATFVGNRSGYPVQGLLLGIGCRMGLPLVALIAFSGRGTLGATLVVVYLLALIADTILTLRMSPANSTVRRNGDSHLTDSKPRPSVAS